MIENTDKMVAAILAAARFQKSTATSTRSIVEYYDECLTALTTPRPPARQPDADGPDAEQHAFERHDREFGGG